MTELGKNILKNMPIKSKDTYRRVIKKIKNKEELSESDMLFCKANFILFEDLRFEKSY